jgi:diguanylate cyclase (GGDEF)-like protein
MAFASGRSSISRARFYGVIGALCGLAYALFALVVDRYTSYDLAVIHLLIAPTVAAGFAFVLGREEDRIRIQAGELEGARDKFTSLAQSAITVDDWKVNLHDTRVPTCWQVQECESPDCPAYGKHHVRCWLIAGTYCRGEVQGRFAQKLDDCATCGVYREAIGNDAMNQIGETFNCLIYAISEKQELLAEANSELAARYRELKEQEEATRRAAETDALTGLKNYGHFRRHLKKVVGSARRYGRPLSMMLMDLKRFKDINNEFGFVKGDQVLKRVGELLREETGRGYYLARYGGEDFVVLMPGAEGEEACAYARRLQTELTHVAEDEGLGGEYLAADFGIADIPDCATDAASLLSAADTALFFARRQKEGSVAYFCDLSGTELEKGDLDRLGSRLDGAGLATLNALAEAVNVNDQYGEVGPEDLVALAMTMARDLGMNEEQAQALCLATKLHDIGKIGIPGSVLRKTGKLSEEERSLVKRHPEIGRRLLSEAEQIKELISAILYHHERWDGMGYPERLKGEQIPFMARIVGIFDAYRAMRSDRPYRKALSRRQAAAELRKGAGSQFDPDLVERFLDLVEDKSCELEQETG